MNRDTEFKISSTIYERIAAMDMSPAERQVALNAMQDAEMIADAVLWIKRKFERLGAVVFLKPSVKH
jgi:hypothetical protein